MKRFFCQCGQEIYFSNTCCQSCGCVLGYDPVQGRMLSLEPQPGDTLRAIPDGHIYRPCANRTTYGVCNAVLDVTESHTLCLACRLNRTIPNCSRPENVQRWGRIELAKRRLIHGLVSMGLPLEVPVAAYQRGLCFDFLEDQRSNPGVPDEFVTTGHLGGVITLNILEADEVHRAWQRVQSSERYRTVLGHFRHEAGHYYHELLVRDQARFQTLFGDAGADYRQAMKSYYAVGPLAGWETSYISAYATSHPLEDWAECFAHYLHMHDALETAAARGVIAALPEPCSMTDMLPAWDQLAVSLNELNRSLGLADAYPFVVTPAVAEKLQFVDEAVRSVSGGVVT